MQPDPAYTRDGILVVVRLYDASGIVSRSRQRRENSRSWRHRHFQIPMHQEKSRFEFMNKLNLRKARPEDSEFAYRVKRAAFKEYVEQVWGWDEKEQRKLHEQRFKAQDFWVINLAGKDIGIMAMVMAPDCVRLNQLFLLPEHQGKGIGCECMKIIMEEAHQLGLPVRLRILKVNPRALAFFQKLGFTRTGETDTHDLMEKDS